MPRTQEKLLRAYAPVLPWYISPPGGPAPSVDDFSEYLRTRLLDILKPQNDPAIRMQDLQSRRRALRHINYQILQRCTTCLTKMFTAEEMAEGVRNDMLHVTRYSEMVLPTPHHPLYGTPLRARTEFRSGMQIQVMDADTKDRELARWISDRIDQLIQALPELTQPHRICRVSEAAPRLRGRIRDILGDGTDGKNYPTEIQRKKIMDTLIEEWLNIIVQMKVEERAEQAAKDNGFNGILNSMPMEALEKLRLETMTREQEEKLNPLLQQLAMLLATNSAAVGDLNSYTSAWAKMLVRLGVPACDRPSISIAMLACMSQHSDTTIDDLRLKLGSIRC